MNNCVIPAHAGIQSFSLEHYFQSIWYHPISAIRPQILAPVLSCASALYARALAYDRQRTQRVKLPLPVISVGNLVVGGTGKTPLTLWLARHLAGRGVRPAILSRGHGRQGRGVAQVQLSSELDFQTKLYGDEPVLLAQKLAPLQIWVGKERRLAAEQVVGRQGADLLLLDDGFQHWGLERDLDLVLLDARQPFGNGALLPLGPLREPIASLERASALILNHFTPAAEELRLQLQVRFPQLPIFTCRCYPTALRFGLEGEALPWETLQRPLAAFSAIAKPQAFVEMLRSLGAELRRHFVFADHHFYTHAELAGLMAYARKHQALLVTTEKDAVRLPNELRSQVLTLELALDFAEDASAFADFLTAQLKPC